VWIGFEFAAVAASRKTGNKPSGFIEALFMHPALLQTHKFLFIKLTALMLCNTAIKHSLVSHKNPPVSV
jgi:hypothetical protein